MLMTATRMMALEVLQLEKHTVQPVGLISATIFLFVVILI